MNNIKSFLVEKFGDSRVLIDEPMSKHTTFRIGGKADYYIIPDFNEEEKIIETIKYCKENKINYVILGNGSNVLVSDDGIRGVVISLKSFDTFEIDGDVARVGAGLSIAKLSHIYAENGFSGLEFACGIPGTVGGAIYMNAGAYGGEIKDVIDTVTYIDLDSLDVKTISNNECGFAYRESVFHRLNTIILSCTTKYTKGNEEEIKQVMKENMNSRNAKQPVSMPCAGSIFRREEGFVVAKLIDDAGLKGYKIGGAEVSTLHAGFIVNTGNATAKDVMELIKYIKKVILEKYNVSLHEEIILL